MPTTRTTRFWIALGSPRAVRIVFALMLVYALVIGGLMLGYASVQSCLAEYTDEAALSTRIRLQTAADRKLNQRIEDVNTSDRARIIANQKATRELLIAAREDGTASRRALDAYIRISDESLDIFAVNEAERRKLAQERARIDAIRATAPAPASPSDRC